MDHRLVVLLIGEGVFLVLVWRLGLLATTTRQLGSRLSSGSRRSGNLRKAWAAIRQLPASAMGAAWKRTERSGAGAYFSGRGWYCALQGIKSMSWASGTHPCGPLRPRIHLVGPLGRLRQKIRQAIGSLRRGEDTPVRVCICVRSRYTLHLPIFRMLSPARVRHMGDIRGDVSGRGRHTPLKKRMPSPSC